LTLELLHKSIIYIRANNRKFPINGLLLQTYRKLDVDTVTLSVKHRTSKLKVFYFK